MNCPKTYTEINETGCCAVPNRDGWDQQVVHLDDRTFIRVRTRSIFFVPLNMAKVMAATQQMVDEAGAAMPATEAMMLTRELSPFRAEHLFAVTRPLAGADNVTLTGDFATRVFEGPYSQAGKWSGEIRSYAREIGRTPTDVYFFYTTCPNCAKHYGKNYVFALARLEESADATAGTMMEVDDGVEDPRRPDPL